MNFMVNKWIWKMIVIYVDKAQSYRLHPFKFTAQSSLHTVWLYFCQVLLDMSHSAAILSALARHPVSTGKESMSAVETFILELLNLTKDSILEVKVTAIPVLLGIFPSHICHIQCYKSFDRTTKKVPQKLSTKWCVRQWVA